MLEEIKEIQAAQRGVVQNVFFTSDLGSWGWRWRW
jgi:hypothetical protein